MKSIKTKLLFTILSIVLGFGMLILVITLSQLTAQRNTIQEQGMNEAQTMTRETTETLSTLNEQTAEQFASSCAKYFNYRFANIRRHVQAIQKKLTDLYREDAAHYGENRLCIVKGVSWGDVRQEYGIISPLTDFIFHLPEYNSRRLENLDLYYMTDSGMCVDGVQKNLRTGYLDLRKENWYETIKKSGKTYWSGRFTGQVSGKEKVLCGMPVYDKNRHFRGCAVGDITVGSFQKLIDEFDEKQVISVIFFDRDNNEMYATNEYKQVSQVRQYAKEKKTVTNGNEIYAFTELEETGWTICLVIDQESVRQTTEDLQNKVEKNAEGMVGIVQSGIRKILLFFIASMAAGIFLTAIITNVVSAGFVRPIRSLMEQVKIIGSGNLSHEISVRSRDEIGQLAGAFQEMTGELQDYMDHLQSMTADKERMAAELDVARQIQMNMLPIQFPAFPDHTEFDVCAGLRSVDAGGGSFYDYFMVDKTHLCIVVGDVTGTGIPTTLFAVITKTNVKNYAQLGYMPDRILLETNNQLSSNNDAGLNVSAFVGIIDLQSGLLQYTAAGQIAARWKHSGTDFELLEGKPCFELGNMENVPYWKQSVCLSQGDMLFVHTQGLAETVDDKGNEYTAEYVYDYLNAAVRHQYELLEIVESMKKDQEQFAGDAVQQKDSVLMLFRFYGK